MLRKHASLIAGILLVLLVAGACVGRASRPAARRGGPADVKKPKNKKHKHKHKKHTTHRKGKWWPASYFELFMSLSIVRPLGSALRRSAAATSTLPVACAMPVASP